MQFNFLSSKLPSVRIKKVMKAKIIYYSEYILGELFIVYSLILHFINPGTLFSTFISFSNIWIFIGAFFIFLAIYRKNHQKSFWFALKKWHKKAAIIIFSLGILISSVNLFFIRHPSLSSKPDSKYVIILGGGIDRNGQLPQTVRNRVGLAADYLNQNKNALAIASGGSLYNLPREAPAMKKLLMENGIEEERILIDDQALDTIQNFKNSCRILAENQNVPQSQILESDVLIVTSFFHLARAQRLARRMGFTKITGLGTKTPVIKVLDCYCREICAYIKLNLRILLTGKPEKISG